MFTTVVMVGHEKVIEVIEQFDNFKIGHSLESTTKSIQLCNLPDSDIFLADSCGFDDSEGVLVNISNAIILRNVMRSFTSVYPVLVIDVRNLFANKASSFTKLLKLISRFFSPIVDVIQNISFLFTHCLPNITASSIQLSISKLLKTDYMLQNLEMKVVVEYILKYVQQHGLKTILFPADMTSDTCPESRQAVLNLIQSAPPITDFTTLGHPLSSEAQIGILEKCKECRISIMLLLERFEYRTVQSELDILKTLHEKIGLPSVTEQYEMAFNGIVSHITDLIHTADVNINNQLYENLNENLQKISDARALQDYFDVTTEFNRLLKSLDVIIKDICQVILSTSETTPDSLLAMDQMTAIHNDVSKFIQSDAKNSYTMLKNEIEGRARGCNNNCASVIENLQSITTINKATKESYDDIESYLSQSQDLFQHLSQLQLMKSFDFYLSPQWIACYDDRLDGIISVLEDLRVDVFDENGLMSLIKRQQCDDMTLSRLSFVHGILKGICSSGMKGHSSNLDLVSVDVHIVQHVTDIINEFSQNIDTYILDNQFTSIVNPLKIISSVFLDDDNFNSMKNNIVKHLQEIISKKLHIIYMDTIQLQSDLLQRDVVEVSDYSKVVDNTKLLQEATCLDHLLLLGTSEIKDNIKVSDWVRSIITAATSEWQQRLKNMNESITVIVQGGSGANVLETILPNTAISIFLRLDRMALPLENLFTNATITTIVDVHGDMNTLINTITSILVEIIQFNNINELNPLKLKMFLHTVISWMEFLPSIENSISMSSGDLMSVIHYIPLLTRKKCDVIIGISKSLKDMKDKAHEAFLNRSCSVVRHNLDLLQEYIVLDEFLDLKPIVIYEECKSFLRLEMNLMNTSANNYVSNGELDKANEIKTFFENASVLTSHLLEYDFNSMAQDLLGKHREAADKIYDEIQLLLLHEYGDNNNFDLIRDKLRNVLKDKNASECESEEDEKVAIDSLLSVLQKCDGAMALTGMISHDPEAKHLTTPHDTIRIDFKQRREDLLTNDILNLKDHLLNTCQELLIYNVDMNNNESMDFYEPDFEEIENLMDNVKTADTSDQVLFNDQVDFKEIKRSILRLILKFSQDINSSFQKLLYKKEFEKTSQLHDYMKSVSGIAEEFMLSSNSSKLRQQCNRQAADINSSKDEDIIHRFSFSSYDIDKLAIHLDTLHQTSLSSYKESLRIVSTRIIEEYKKFEIFISNTNIISDSCNNKNNNEFKNVFEFIHGLWEFECQIGCPDDSQLKDIVIRSNNQFHQFLSSRVGLCKITLLQNDNIVIIKQELSLIHEAIMNGLITLGKCIRLIQSKCQESNATSSSYWERVSQNITTHQSFLNVWEEKCASLLNEALSKFNILVEYEKNMGKFNLFHEENMNDVLEKLIFLAKQTGISQHRGGMHNDEINDHRSGEIFEHIKKQLHDSIQKVYSLLLNKDYSTLSIGVHNIQKLEKPSHFKSICIDINKEIFAIVQEAGGQLLHNFAITFEQNNTRELDKIVQDAEAWDTSFVSLHYEPLMERVKSEFSRVMNQSIERDKANASTIDDHARIMINIKAFVEDISSTVIQQLAHQRIGRYIETLSIDHIDLFALGTSLADLGPLGVLITEEYPQFKAVLTKRFNQATARISIDHTSYEIYLTTYLPGYGNSFLPPPPLTHLVKHVRERARRFNEKFDLVEVLAGVFAVWTILSSKDMFKDTNDRSCLIKPHTIQIVAIFCLLGLDRKDGMWRSFSKSFSAFTAAIKTQPTLDGHLIQVGTGKGKSILLGGLSCLLAIFGYEVSCASYSKYLSDRDYEAFKELFILFEVNQDIKYSTLSGLMDAVINRNGDIRELTKQRLFNVPTSTHTKLSKSNSTAKKILLIDEVDVFFSKDFFGATYNPLTTYQSEETVAILTHIFDNRNSALTLQQIKALPAYITLIDKCYNEVIPIIDNQLNRMLRDVKTFNQSPYEVVTVKGIGKRIGYKTLDCVNTNIKHGYKTSFAYLYEASKDESMRAVANDELILQFQCGSFSFADVPNNYFQCIMGVTGTLSCLSAAEKGIVQNDYKIRKLTITPSIYGDSKLNFRKNGDVILIEEGIERYYQTILKEIQDERGKGRPVLVFFETETKLRQFENSDYGKRVDDMNVVTEKTDNVEYYVNKATSLNKTTALGTVTLFPKVFGRGLDFVCRDNAVDDAGGVHVIQTFFSDYTSEEIQIKGRTARQTKRGSYKLILLLDHLTKLGLTAAQILTAYQSLTFYDQLQERREQFISDQVQGLRVKATLCKAIHDKSTNFIENLLNPRTSLDEIVKSIQSFG
eukprot:gene1955-3795_t